MPTPQIILKVGPDAFRFRPSPAVAFAVTHAFERRQSYRQNDEAGDREQ
jgi:hypothetical protein